MGIPKTNEVVIYVDHEGREYEARVLVITAELAVMGAENGNWTVIGVPYGKDGGGAHWKELDTKAVNTKTAKGAKAAKEGDEKC